MSAEADLKSLLLDYYHCTFFLPLIGLDEQIFVPADRYAFTYKPAAPGEEAKKEEEKTEREKREEAQAQAYRYFSPALRKILFDSGEQERSDRKLVPLKEWRLDEKEIESWSIHRGKEVDRTDPIQYQIAKVLAVNLYRYLNGVYLLSFRVEPEALQQLRKNNACPLFNGSNTVSLHDLILSDHGNETFYRQLQLECWLRFTRLARLVYPSFPEQNDENKIAPIRLFTGTGTEPITAFGTRQKVRIHEKPGEDISPLIRFLLKSFSIKPNELLEGFIDEYENLYDDRIFVSVAYGLANCNLEASRINKIYSLAAYVDRFKDTFNALDGYAYTPDEIEARLRPQTFALWKGLGGQYAYTDTANVYVYCGRDCRKYIGPHHIPFIYDRMLVQALLYQASLRLYDNDISTETNNMLEQRNIKSIREQRQEFIRFTNQYWFHQITEQMQGKEIFKLQQKALGLAEHYEIIKDELERTDEYLQTEHEIRMANLSDRLSRWGFAIALIAIYYSVLPLLKEFVEDSTGKSIWGYVWSWINLPIDCQEIAGLIILLGAPIYILILLLIGTLAKQLMLQTIFYAGSSVPPTFLS
ncbi:MAG: hypothetical protein ACRERU_06505 [Methylococcales bacterium]